MTTPESAAATATGFDLKSLVQSRMGEQMSLLEAHINPRFATVLKTIGFDRAYVRGEGQYLWDDKGHRYLDMLSGYGMFNIGRNHPVLKQTVRDFLDLDDPWKVQMGPSLLPGLLAEELKKRVGRNLDTVFFTNSGTECNETAIKYARAATGRERILYIDRAFHGLSCGSLAINGCESFRKGFGTTLPNTVKLPFNDLAALEAGLKAEKCAALVLEIVQGKGVFAHTTEYLQGAQALCKKFGTLLVVDEVQTGFGRTGKMFAIEHVPGLEPDILLLSKALSGGYVPVGAVMARRAIYDKVFSSLDRCVVHSTTFGQGALAMACGLATLHVLDEENLVANSAEKGEKLMAGLREMQSRYELIGEIRGKGLMIAIEFKKPKLTSIGLRLGWEALHRIDGGLFAQAIIMPLLDEHKILTQVAGHNQDIIKLIPALTLTDADVTTFLTAFESVMKGVHSGGGAVWEIIKKLTKFAVSSERG